MIDLRSPHLRPRDLRRIVGPKLHTVAWDAGVAGSEWVYASAETDLRRETLISWLRSKGVRAGSEALLFDRSWSAVQPISWDLLVSTPGIYFADAPFLAISTPMTWVLEYMKEGVARFGRFPAEPPNKLPEHNALTRR